MSDDVLSTSLPARSVSAAAAPANPIPVVQAIVLTSDAVQPSEPLKSARRSSEVQMLRQAQLEEVSGPRQRKRKYDDEMDENDWRAIERVISQPHQRQQISTKRVRHDADADDPQAERSASQSRRRVHKSVNAAQADSDASDDAAGERPRKDSASDQAHSDSESEEFEAIADDDNFYSRRSAEQTARAARLAERPYGKHEAGIERILAHFRQRSSDAPIPSPLPVPLPGTDEAAQTQPDTNANSAPIEPSQGSDDIESQMWYLVKFQGMSHLHCLWLPRCEIVDEFFGGEALLVRYEAKLQVGHEIEQVLRDRKAANRSSRDAARAIHKSKSEAIHSAREEMKRLQDQRLMRRARRLRRQRSGTPTSFSLPSEINRTLPASDMVASASLNLSVIATYFSDDSAEDEGTSTTTSFAPITVVNARTFLQTDTDAARIMRFQLEDKVFDQRMASLDQQQNEADNAFDQLEKAQRSACSALIYTRDTQVTRYAGFTGYFNPEYVQIDRIIFECLADGRQVAISASASQQETTHYLVKWQSQSYAQATWESVQTFSQLPNSAAAIQSYRAVLGACSTTATTFDQVKTAQSTRRMMARPPYTGDEVFKGGKKLLPYQISGSNWLALNYHQHRNSLLADEMGLGKTVQSIMFLKYLRTTAPESGLFLVVAPLSTMQHWRREIESFTDDMYAVVYHGSAEDRAVLREREWNVYNQQNEVVEGATRFQVLITNFETLRTDLKFFLKVPWHCLVVDEAQRIKGVDSIVRSDMMRIPREHVVLLTGTPIQNSMEELWSLLNFLDPSNFDSLAKFMESHGVVHTPEQVAALSRDIGQYILRRMKSDVDQKLLPKEEIIVEVEMTHLQKRYYRAIFERNLSLLKTSAPTSSSKKSARDSQISLRNVSMQLRKCCDHPYLLEGVEDEVLHTLRDERKRGVEPTSDFGFVPTPHQNGAASVNHNTAPGHVTVTDDDIYRQLILASGKLVLLDKLLAKLLRTGHKVLIFSQMTRVLDLLQDYCQYRNYQTERLDGNIKGSDRQEAIDRFSRPQSSSFIFLLSTRAGGVGLTLTAADTVILFDCDWNPQNDIQAQARVHRIGQTKPVKIYRLVTRGTYESEMFARATGKLALDAAVLQSAKQSNERATEAEMKLEPCDKALIAQSSAEAFVPSNAAGANADGDGDDVTRDEMAQMMRSSALQIFGDEQAYEQRAREFYTDDIDQILARAHVVRTDPTHVNTAASALSSFSKARFLPDGATDAIDLNDPDFWSKVGINEDPSAVQNQEHELILPKSAVRSSRLKQKVYNYDNRSFRANMNEDEEMELLRRMVESQNNIEPDVESNSSEAEIEEPDSQTDDGEDTDDVPVEAEQSRSRKRPKRPGMAGTRCAACGAHSHLREATMQCMLCQIFLCTMHGTRHPAKMSSDPTVAHAHVVVFLSSELAMVEKEVLAKEALAKSMREARKSRVGLPRLGRRRGTTKKIQESNPDLDSDSEAYRYQSDADNANSSKFPAEPLVRNNRFNHRNRLVVNVDTCLYRLGMLAHPGQLPDGYEIIGFDGLPATVKHAHPNADFGEFEIDDDDELFCEGEVPRHTPPNVRQTLISATKALKAQKDCFHDAMRHGSVPLDSLFLVSSTDPAPDSVVRRWVKPAKAVVPFAQGLIDRIKSGNILSDNSHTFVKVVDDDINICFDRNPNPCSMAPNEISKINSLFPSFVLVANKNRAWGWIPSAQRTRKLRYRTRFLSHLRFLLTPERLDRALRMQEQLLAHALANGDLSDQRFKWTAYQRLKFSVLVDVLSKSVARSEIAQKAHAPDKSASSPTARQALTAAIQSASTRPIIEPGVVSAAAANVGRVDVAEISKSQLQIAILEDQALLYSIRAAFEHAYLRAKQEALAANEEGTVLLTSSEFVSVLFDSPCNIFVLPSSAFLKLFDQTPGIPMSLATAAMKMSSSIYRFTAPARSNAVPEEQRRVFQFSSQVPVEALQYLVGVKIPDFAVAPRDMRAFVAGMHRYFANVEVEYATSFGMSGVLLNALSRLNCDPIQVSSSNTNSIPSMNLPNLLPPGWWADVGLSAPLNAVQIDVCQMLHHMRCIWRFMLASVNEYRIALETFYQQQYKVLFLQALTSSAAGVFEAVVQSKLPETSGQMVVLQAESGASSLSALQVVRSSVDSLKRAHVMVTGLVQTMERKKAAMYEQHLRYENVAFACTRQIESLVDLKPI